MFLDGDVIAPSDWIEHHTAERRATTPPARTAVANIDMRIYVDYCRHMDTSVAIESFAALSQETRLRAFRLLVQNEPAGLAAGEIAKRLKVPHNTMSTHLSVLSQAGLAISRRESRSIIYRARLSHMEEIVQFLLHDCCSGHPDVCASIASSLSGCASLRAE